MMRSVLVLLSLLLLAAPAGAEPAWVGPADTGLPSNPALGTRVTTAPSPSSSAAPRSITPPSTGPMPASPPATGQPSEACRRFPNLC